MAHGRGSSGLDKGSIPSLLLQGMGGDHEYELGKYSTSSIPLLVYQGYEWNFTLDLGQAQRHVVTLVRAGVVAMALSHSELSSGAPESADPCQCTTGAC